LGFTPVPAAAAAAAAAAAVLGTGAVEADASCSDPAMRCRIELDAAGPDWVDGAGIEELPSLSIEYTTVLGILCSGQQRTHEHEMTYASKDTDTNHIGIVLPADTLYS